MQLHIRNGSILVSLLCVFVVLPPTLFMMSFVSRKLMQMWGAISGGILGDTTGSILLMWAAIPGSIFGEPAFENSMFFGIAPAGNLGWVITVLFWTAFSVILWVFTVIFRWKKIRNGIRRDAKQVVP